MVFIAINILDCIVLEIFNTTNCDYLCITAIIRIFVSTQIIILNFVYNAFTYQWEILKEIHSANLYNFFWNNLNLFLQIKSFEGFNLKILKQLLYLNRIYVYLCFFNTEIFYSFTQKQIKSIISTHEMSKFISMNDITISSVPSHGKFHRGFVNSREILDVFISSQRGIWRIKFTMSTDLRVSLETETHYHKQRKILHF